jgi:transcriptional regulator with XRE-family HTH domain
MKPEGNPKDALVGATLREIREGAEMSQRTLAKAAGVNHSHLSRVEAGKATLSPDFQAKVLAAIDARLHHKGDVA